ncbi:MAG: bifunctional phosphopantothenoylcysteine decarboxylase/phosphopantothenate--cysteine ligase CoaBC [Planctomycetota bacterium]|jgi:phosphopantothenoylcysteine decarboxylase/phosphopantothenate--cysteine ligase
MAKRESNIEGVQVLLGVSGGIAAFKAVDLASKLTGAGAKVRTVMTENACRLVGPKSFEAVTQSPVYTDLWGASEDYKVGHVALAEWADIVVVAPATANIIGKIANGICDDLLSTVLCTCWAKPAFLAPAMNENMWNNPAVQRNIETVKKMGFELAGPERGRLACGVEGVGRMSEPQDILEAIEKIASKVKA